MGDNNRSLWCTELANGTKSVTLYCSSQLEGQHWKQAEPTPLRKSSKDEASRKTPQSNYPFDIKDRY